MLTKPKKRRKGKSKCSWCSGHFHYFSVFLAMVCLPTNKQILQIICSTFAALFPLNAPQWLIFGSFKRTKIPNFTLIRIQQTNTFAFGIWTFKQMLSRQASYNWTEQAKVKGQDQGFNGSMELAGFEHNHLIKSPQPWPADTNKLNWAWLTSHDRSKRLLSYMGRHVSVYVFTL